MSTFSDCTALKDIKLPNSLRTISSSAFYSCTSLTTITIPDNVTSIGELAFRDCTNLKTIYYNGSLRSDTNWGATNATIQKY